MQLGDKKLIVQRASIGQKALGVPTGLQVCTLYIVQYVINCSLFTFGLWPLCDFFYFLNLFRTPITLHAATFFLQFFGAGLICQIAEKIRSSREIPVTFLKSISQRECSICNQERRWNNDFSKEKKRN